jgi:Predicted transcriptional regulator
MGWASGIIEQLQQGKTLVIHPRGNSMTPRIQSGQAVTVRPLTADEPLNKGEIVLCKMHGAEYLHQISAVGAGRYQISNNHGHVNGWVGRKQIFGKVISL